jgi:spore germination cell wall hydrolase CwlJ-like protein
METEVDCLAHNIYFESRNQSTSSQFAVGFVTLNRVKDSRFPNTICKVVKQRHQFSWLWDDIPDKPLEKKAYAIAKKIATLLMSGKFTDNTGGALFYHSKEVMPKWAKQLKFIAQYEDHLFYTYKNIQLN